MVRWPDDKTSATDVYELNEKGTGGYYPVGLNDMWHSGIHIPRGKGEPIYPLLDGKLVDHRIREDYKEVDKKPKITLQEWKKLTKTEQNHYTERRFFYELTGCKKNSSMSKTSRLTSEANCEPDCKAAKDLYSDNFVLMSHEILANASDKKKIKFYTLYMNLAPYNYEEYVDIDINSSNLKIPFYQERKFLVKADMEDIPEYTYVSGATLGNLTEKEILKSGDQFAMVNGDDDFFLSDGNKDVVVIQRYNTGGVKLESKTVVEMADIKGKLKVKSVPSIGNMMEARKELTTRQCIGFPASLPSNGEYLYDLVLILEKDLLSGGTGTLDAAFFKNNLYYHANGGYNLVDTSPQNNLRDELIRNCLSAVENGYIANVIDNDEYVKLSDFDYYYKRDH